MNWFCVCKSQEEGDIITEIPLQKVVAGTKFWTCDLTTQIFFNLKPYLPCRIWPFSWLHTIGPHSSGHYSGGPHCSSSQQAVWNTVQTFQEPVCLERVCCPSAWFPCSRNGAQLWFCQHMEFPNGLPSKYYPGPMLLNFSIRMQTGVSN